MELFRTVKRVFVDFSSLFGGNHQIFPCSDHENHIFPDATSSSSQTAAFDTEYDAIESDQESTYFDEERKSSNGEGTVHEVVDLSLMIESDAAEMLQQFGTNFQYTAEELTAMDPTTKKELILKYLKFKIEKHGTLQNRATIQRRFDISKSQLRA